MRLVGDGDTAVLEWACQEVDQVEHMGIAFIEVASAGNLGAHAPWFLLFGETLFGGLALGAYDVDAAHGADGSFVEQALQFAVAGHAAAVVGGEAARPRFIEGALDVLRVFPRKGKGLLEVAVLAGMRHGDRVVFVAVRRRCDVDDVDRRIGEQFIEGLVGASVPVACAPVARFRGRAVPYPRKFGMVG